MILLLKINLKFVFFVYSILHFLLMLAVSSQRLQVTFSGLAKVAILEHYTVNQSQTLLEAQSLI